MWIIYGEPGLNSNGEIGLITKPRSTNKNNARRPKHEVKA